jgi:hypothetical protein
MMGIPHCLDSRLRDGGEVVNLTHRMLSTPQKLFYFRRMPSSGMLRHVALIRTDVSDELSAHFVFLRSLLAASVASYG